MGRENRDTGICGEKKAIEFLKKKGYRMLEENFRTPFGEIDAVAKKKGFIIFIEIKTRTSYSLGLPCLAVTVAKQRHIIKNALYYLKRRGAVWSDWRVDVVSVNLDHENNTAEIEIIENAVEDDYGRY